METIQITTPGGYVATLKKNLTYGDRRQIQRVYADGVFYDADAGKYRTKGSAVYDATEKAVELLVLKIQDKDGQEITGENALKTILSWTNEEDAKFIFDEVDKLTQQKQLSEEDKKK